MSGSAKCLKFRQFGTLLKCVNVQNMTSQSRRKWKGRGGNPPSPPDFGKNKMNHFFFKIFGVITKKWQYGLSSFEVRDTKLERFLPKNQHNQSK